MRHTVGAEAEGDLHVPGSLAALLERVTLGVDAVAGVAPTIGALVIAHGQGHPAVRLLRDDLGVCRPAILKGEVRGAAAAAGMIAPLPVDCEKAMAPPVRISRE